jgi:hypothetical protein
MATKIANGLFPSKQTQQPAAASVVPQTDTRKQEIKRGEEPKGKEQLEEEKEKEEEGRKSPKAEAVSERVLSGEESPSSFSLADSSDKVACSSPAPVSLGLRWMPLLQQNLSLLLALVAFLVALLVMRKGA